MPPMAMQSYKQMTEQLGQTIKRLREERALSQENLAEQLEVSRTYLAYIETGTRTPSVKILHKIATILQVAMKDLFS